MPMYDYHCQCGREFEALRKYSESQAASCPSCIREAPKALSAPAGICGGFYDTSVRINRQKQTFISSIR